MQRYNAANYLDCVNVSDLFSLSSREIKHSKINPFSNISVYNIMLLNAVCFFGNQPNKGLKVSADDDDDVATDQRSLHFKQNCFVSGNVLRWCTVFTKCKSHLKLKPELICTSIRLAPLERPSAALRSCTHLHKNLPSMDCTAVTPTQL